MTPIQELELRRSAIRQELGELGQTEGDEAVPRIEELEVELRSTEPRLRALKLAEDDVAHVGDAIDNDRIELRSRVSLGRWIGKILERTNLDGAEAELASELGTQFGRVPFEAFERFAPVEMRADTFTTAPTTVARTMDAHTPLVFSESIAPYLGVQTKSITSGTLAEPRVTADGGSSVSSAAPGDVVDAVGVTVDVLTTNMHRITTRIGWRWEDRKLTGIDEWDQMLAQTARNRLSNALDNYLLTGLASGNTNKDPQGLLAAIGSAPTDPSSAADWDDYVGLYSGAVDGRYAGGVDDVRIMLSHHAIAAAENIYKISGSGATAGIASNESCAAYLRRVSNGLRGTDRMTYDATSKVSQGIAFRAGAMTMPAVMRPAIIGHYGEIEIGDPYSLAASAQETLTIHCGVSDVLVLHGSMFKRVAVKVSS